MKTKRGAHFPAACRSAPPFPSCAPSRKPRSARLSLPLYAAFVLCAASCASTTFSQAAPVSVPEDFIGISPDRTGLAPRYMEQLDAFGAAWIRQAANWEGMEKKPGEWDFSKWDDYLDKAEAAGKKFLLILCYDVPWLYPDNDAKRHLTEAQIPLFLNYVETFVKRYRGRIGAVEIWNEPNVPKIIPSIGFWKGTRKEFYKVSKAAADKVKEVAPEIPVVAGAMFRVYKKFTRGMFESGAMENADGISVHPYSSDPLHTLKQIDKLKKSVGRYRPGIPVWVTEVGYPTAGFWFGQPTEDNSPEYIVKTLAGLAVRGVEHAIWYELMDEYNEGAYPNRWYPGSRFGLIHPDLSPKKGAAAFALCGRFLPGAEYRPEFPVREKVAKSVTSLYFKKNDSGENILLLWNGGQKTGATSWLEIPGGEDMAVYDIVSGEARSAGKESGQLKLRLGKEPLIIVWKGGGVPVLRGRAQ